MKVVCIDDYTLISGKKIIGITVGKIYDARESNCNYLIIDDNGYPTWYSDDALMPLEKYRELKLKELGIDLL